MTGIQPPTAIPALTMSSDILAQVCELAGAAATPSMLAVHPSWNRALKSQLTSLSPAYLDGPSDLLAGFKSVRTISAPLNRTSQSSFVSNLTVIQLPLQQPALLLSLFPSLTGIDLSRQVLPAGLVVALAGGRHQALMRQVSLAGVWVCGWAGHGV